MNFASPLLRIPVIIILTLPLFGSMDIDRVRKSNNHAQTVITI